MVIKHTVILALILSFLVISGCGNKETEGQEQKLFHIEKKLEKAQNILDKAKEKESLFDYIFGSDESIIMMETTVETLTMQKKDIKTKIRLKKGETIPKSLKVLATPFIIVIIIVIIFFSVLLN